MPRMQETIGYAPLLEVSLNNMDASAELERAMRRWACKSRRAGKNMAEALDRMNTIGQTLGYGEHPGPNIGGTNG